MSTRVSRSTPSFRALIFSTFAVVYSMTVVAPLVGQIAAELDITPGAVGLLAAAYSLPGIAAAVLSGPYADRLGRRRFLVGGALVCGLFTVIGAFAPNYPLLLVARAIAGLGGALILPNMIATVADLFPYDERAPAVATTYLANTAGALAGVAVAGILAEQAGWRASLAASGLLSLGSALALAVWPAPQSKPPAGRGALAAYATVLSDRSAIAMLAANALGVAAWLTWMTFIVAFLQDRFALAQGMASAYALVQGGGMLVGTQLGGRLGARFSQRGLLAVSLSLYGILLPAVTADALGLGMAVGLNFVAAVFFGMRSTANQTLLSEHALGARTTMLSFAGAGVAVGTVVGASVGGAVFDLAGFGALALFCCACALASSAVVVLLVRERTRDGATAGAVVTPGI